MINQKNKQRSEELAKRGIRNYLENMLSNILNVDGKDAARVRAEIRDISERDINMVYNAYRKYNTVDYDPERDEIKNLNMRDLRLVCRGYIIGKTAKIRQVWKKEKKK